MDGNYSLSDIAAASGGEGMLGGNGGMWIFALLILLLLGNGGGLFGGSGSAATNADLQRAIDLNSIQEGQAGISADIQRGIYEINGATKDAAYNNLSEIRDIQNVVNTGFANMQTCCCETQRSIDSVNYNLASQSAAIQANDTANSQKILDAINQNKVETLQSQINNLQLQQALCGVPKINPYGYGLYPSWPMGPQFVQ